MTGGRTDGRGSEKHSGLLPIVNGLEKRATDMYINRRKGDRDYETETMNAISQHRVTNHGFSAELLSLARRPRGESERGNQS